MSHLDSEFILCPYCSSSIEIVVDCSISYQEYVEDCEVCCRPIMLRIRVSPEFDIEISASPENE